ncbi:hypothetical protein EV653_1515 [Kribbella pratensis]|uniref:Uncharacterized protein n=2 Tax=Kribbella pratensis TaxID=2512112 RepID=A0A4R8CIT1_9ACTN|nr:hypothetical protein EV653_1515 [Kribbella pratensis]
MIAVWSADDEELVFGRACDVAGEFGCVLTGVAEEWPAKKVGYHRKGLGTVIVERLFAAEGETHPVAISLSARELGWPEALWTAKDRKAAYKLAGWATDVLRELTARTGALYGSIAVEETLPTPSALRAGISISSLPFLSAELPTAVFDKFYAAFSRTQPVEWPHGTFFPDWKPFTKGSATAPDRATLTAASTTLGNTLQRRKNEQ